MVNRQIRCESLPMFYNNHDFRFDLTSLWDRPDDAEDGRGLLSPFADMIRAFAPSPSKTFEASNLRFLSYLSVNVDTQKGQEDGIILMGITILMGFTMSSKDKSDELDTVLDTTGLDWSDEEEVGQAYVHAAVRGDLIGYEWIFEMDDSTVAAFHELVALMSLLASQCPQLTKRVCALVTYQEADEPTGYELRTDDELFVRPDNV